MTDRDKLAHWMRERGFEHRVGGSFDQLLSDLDAQVGAMGGAISAGFLRMAPARPVAPPKPGRIDPTKVPVSD